MRPVSCVLCALLVLGFEARASAEGTHFLLQANGGVTLTKTGTFGALVGAGGRIGRVRLYALFEASWATAGASGGGATGPWSATLFGADFAGGLRVLVPITDVVRVYVDVLGGGTVGSYSLSRDGRCARTTLDRSGLFDIAAGLDVRLVSELSLGIRGKVHVVDATPAWLSAQQVDLGRDADLTLGLTFHF
jgi:hypothetical protein